MRQLTSLDVQFLAAEDGRTHGHVSAVAILDPSTTATGELTLADITGVFSERLHLLPPLRWRLVEVPLGLDYPCWLDDPDFDLEFHIRELHLPPPGTMSQLAEQVSRIVSRPLDRARPLWECYLLCVHGRPCARPRTDGCRAHVSDGRPRRRAGARCGRHSDSTCLQTSDQ
jgi:hypothetical protein